MGNLPVLLTWVSSEKPIVNTCTKLSKRTRDILAEAFLITHFRKQVYRVDEDAALAEVCETEDFA